MDRREFLIGGVMALAGGAVSRPLFAHPERWDTAGSAARMLLTARVASRRSRAFARGLSMDVHLETSVPAGFGTIEDAVHSLHDSLTDEDSRRLHRNLAYLADHLEDILESRGARHFCSHWHHLNCGSLYEARAHLDSCRACGHAWRIIVRGTDIELIPLIVMDEVTVIAEARGPDPRRQLLLPEVPKSLRPALAGKELRLRVRIDEFGNASVTGIESPGISSFVVKRAVAEVEGTPWLAAQGLGGRPLDDSVRVIFRWRS